MQIDEEGENTSVSSSSTPIFYPAYCYKASPTWFTWVKLTAYDVHHELHDRPEYHHHHNTETSLMFFSNHPIQFVQLIGVVVNVEDHYENYWLFTIDDSSGATIDITCRKPRVQQQTRQKDADESNRMDIMNRLDNGVVVQVKGQISTFRKVRQIQLERITIIPDTNKEMRLISARTNFFKTVLSRPWVVSESTRKKLWKNAVDEEEVSQTQTLRNHRIEQERKEREKRHEIRIHKKYEREEIKRAAAAQVARLAGQELK